MTATRTRARADKAAQAPTVDPFLRMVEVADQIGISRTGVYDYIHDGRLKAEDLNAGTGKRPRLRIRQSVVTAFQNRCEIPIPERYAA